MKKFTLLIGLLLCSIILRAAEQTPPAKPNISITEAAAKGDLKKVEAHVAAGTDINDRDGDVRGKSVWRLLAFLPCLIPIFLVLGIVYAIKTKPTEHAMPTPTKKMLVVTTPTIPGKKVVRVLGLVRGNTIRARHVGKDILAGLRNMVGGEVTEYAKLLAESREQAIDRMLVEAEGLGANAVISVDFQTSVIMGGAAEMMAYGTAVVVEESNES